MVTIEVISQYINAFRLVEGAGRAGGGYFGCSRITQTLLSPY